MSSTFESVIIAQNFPIALNLPNFSTSNFSMRWFRFPVDRLKFLGLLGDLIRCGERNG